MQKKLQHLIYVLISVTFFVPLLVFPSSYIFPFIVPKIIVFRILVLLMLGTYLLLLYSNWQKYRVNITPITVVVLLFLLSWAISTFTGVDWYRSFWDGHERMLGLFTIIHYVLYFLILTTVVRTKQEWKMLMRVFLGAGGFVMLIGVIQRYIDPDALLNGGSERVSASLGNAIYLSGYGLFIFFLGSYLAIKDFVVAKQWMQGFWFWYAVVGGLLGFWGIFLGGTRGTLLGLLATLGIGAVLYIVTLKEHKKLKYTMIGIIVAGIVLLGLAFAFRDTQFVKSIPAVGRLVSASLTSGSGGTRLMAWGVAIDAWQEMPIFGWGPNNYYYAFNEYYNPKFLEHGWGETWFDNAHSAIMNTLAVQGIVGLILYISLFGVPIFILWSAYRKQSIDVHTFILPTAFLVGHFVHNAFVFENPTSYLYFFFVIAFVNSQFFIFNLESSLPKSKKISVTMIAVVVLPIFLIIWMTNVNPARANMTMLNFLRTFPTGDPNMGLYDMAMSYGSPHNDDMQNDFARTTSQYVMQYVQNGLQQKAVDMSQQGFDELQKNRTLHPLDVRVHLTQSQIAHNIAVLTNDTAWIMKKEAILEDAYHLSPKRQQVVYELATTKHMLWKNDEAIVLLEESLEDNKNIEQNWVRLYQLYQTNNMEEKMQQLQQEAQAHDINLPIQ